MKTGVMMLRIKLCITGINYILKYINIVKSNNVKYYYLKQICSVFLIK